MLSLRPWYFLFASFASTLVFSKVAQARSTEKPTTFGYQAGYAHQGASLNGFERQR